MVASLAKRCASEVISTSIGLWLGDSCVANALLPAAKGQSMGFGWLAMGYGFSFFFPGLWFGGVRWADRERRAN